MEETNSKSDFYRVNSPDNFYDDMVGRKIFETPKTYVLRFKLNTDLGGVQVVQFYKHQLEFDGTY